MFPVAIILTTLGLLLLPLALRGRTTARGLFCRRCKFDLAGLDPARADPNCPECGRDLTQPGSTRPILRRVQGPGLVLALLMLTAGAFLTAFALTPRGPAFYAALPDGQLLLLNRLRVDDALTELADRSARTPPLSDAHWRTLIARGLAHQNDTETPWDTRWGLILSQAFLQKRMTEDQLKRYLRHAFETEFNIRDRMAHDATDVGYWLNWKAGRITIVGPTIDTTLRYSNSILRTGLVGDSTPPSQGGGTLGSWVLHASGANFTSALGSAIRVPADTPRDGPIRVYVETRFTLFDADGDVIFQSDPQRGEQTVRILPPGEPVVTARDDPQGAEWTRASASLSPLTITIPEPDSLPRWSTEVARLQINFEDRPHAVAGRLFAVLDTGEVEIGTLRLAAGAGSHGYGVGLGVTPAELPDKLPLIRAIAERSTIDVVFRTDPSIAASDPRIDEVVDVTLLFRNVPVVKVSGPDALYSHHTRADATPAAKLEEPPGPDTPSP